MLIAALAAGIVISIALASFAADERELVRKEKFIEELGRDYEAPPPGARGIAVEPAPSISVTLLFKYDSTELADEQSVRQLQEAAAAFKDRKLAAHKFIVEGHTDSDGDESYNLKLSQARADAVVQLLNERYGLPAAMLRAVGKGESEPVTDNSSDAAKSKNRRVVFLRTT
jgi:outer membrane protein OmpA-like peptidoglycan-associated protein